MDLEGENKPSLEEGLVSADWKVRLVAYNEILQRIPSEGPELLTKFTGVLPKLLCETTPSGMEKGLQVVAQLFEAAVKLNGRGSGGLEIDNRSLMRNLIEKIYAANRQNLAATASSVLLSVYSMGDKQQMNDILQEFLGNKNPKIQQASLTALKEVLHQFGAKEAQWNSTLPKVLLRCSDPNPAVRTSAMEYLKVLAQKQGEAVLSMFKSIKPVQLIEIKNYLEANPGQQQGPQRSINPQAVQAEMDIPQPMNEEDLWEAMEAVKILHKFPEAWAEKVILDAKWTDKKEKLDALDRALSVSKIESAPFIHIVKMLKKLLNDNNIAVHMSCLSVIKKLCKGMKGRFNQGMKALNRSLLLKLKERKPIVTDSVLDTIATGFQCIGLEEVIDEYKDQLKEKNPQTKSSILKILANYVADSGPRVFKSGMLCRALITSAKENLNDGAPEVRKASTDILAEMLRASPKDQTLNKELASLDEKKRNRIIDQSKAMKSCQSGSPKGAARSPTNESTSLSKLNQIMTLKKSQSVTKFAVSKETLNATAGKKSVQALIKPAESIKKPLLSSLSKPSQQSDAPGSLGMKKSQSAANLTGQPSVSLLLEELKSPMGVDEAMQYLQHDCQVPNTLIAQLGQSNWKERQESLRWFRTNMSAGKVNDPEGLAAEAVMTLIKKRSNDFKEANINLVKDMIGVAEVLAGSAIPKTAHLILELLVEKYPTFKSSEQIKSIISNIKERLGIRKLFSSVLGNLKDKFSNPKVAASAISLLKQLVIENRESTGSIPFKELGVLAKGAFQNPNIQVRHSSIELFSAMMKFSKDASLKDMIADLNPIQKKMIEEEEIKLNTLLNSSPEKDFSQKMIESLLADEDAVTQTICLQMILQTFVDKKVSLSEEHKRKLIEFIYDSLKNNTEPKTVAIQLLPHFARKYKREIETCLPKLLSALADQAKIGAEHSVDALRSICDLYGMQSFNVCPEFKELPLEIRNDVMRTPGLSDILPALQAICNQQNITVEMVPPLSSHKTQYSPPRKSSVADHSMSASKMDLETISLAQGSAHQRESSHDIVEKRRTKARMLEESEQFMIVSPATELTFDETKRWKDHKIDLVEPKDAEILELKKMLRLEVGEELIEKMFSYEIHKLGEAIQKVETRMRQKAELEGLWELMLKWVFVRIFECSRDLILKEFARMIVRLINFADRAGRHFNPTENDLIFKIMLQVINSEDSSSVDSFSSIFVYHLIIEHKLRTLNLLMSHIPNVQVRSRSRYFLLLAAFLRRTSCPFPPNLLMTLIHSLEEYPDNQKEAKLGLKAAMEQIPEDNRQTVFDSIISSENLTIKGIEEFKKIAAEAWSSHYGHSQFEDDNLPEYRAKSAVLEDLRQEIEDVAVNSQLKNLVVLKKIVELMKVKTEESVEFLSSQYLSIMRLMTFMLQKHLHNHESFSDRIIQTQENFECVRMMLEYIQKICGCTALLTKLSADRFAEFIGFVTDCLITVDSDKKKLELNVDQLYTDKTMKNRENMSKFLNSATLRLLEGPTNKIFEALFGLLKSIRLRGPHSNDSHETRKSKVLVKCIIELGKRLDSSKEDLCIPDLFNSCMDYMKLYSSAEHIDKTDLGVKAVKTILNDICLIYQERVWDFLEQARQDQPVEGFLRRWLKLILANDKESDGISILSGRRNLFKANAVNPTEDAQFATTAQPRAVIINLPEHLASLEVAKSSPQATNLRLSPQLDYLQTTFENILIKNISNKGTDSSPAENKPEVYSKHIGYSANPPLNNICPPQMDLEGPGDNQFSEVEESLAPTSRRTGSEKGRGQADPSLVSSKYTNQITEEEISVEEPEVTPQQQAEDFKAGLKKITASNGSRSEYSEYKESFMRSSIGQNVSLGELQYIKLGTAHQEVDEKTQENLAFNNNSFGKQTEVSVKSITIDEPLDIQMVKHVPSEVLSLGKRSVIEKSRTDTPILEIDSPLRDSKKKNVPGKFSLNIKDQKFSPEKYSQDLENKTPARLNETQTLLIVGQDLRTLFSPNKLVLNLQSPIKSTRSYGPAEQMPLNEQKATNKHRAPGSPITLTQQDPILARLFKEYRSCSEGDSLDQAMMICQYIRSSDDEKQQLKSQTLKQISGLDKDKQLILERELLFGSRDHLQASSIEPQLSPFTDENRQSNSITEIRERLALIRDKYKNKQTSSPVGQAASLDIEEFKDRERRIDDFKQKIQSLLKGKRMLEC